jgi:hypothetical protein
MIDFVYLLKKQGELNKAAGNDTEEMGKFTQLFDKFAEKQGTEVKEQFQDLFYDYYLALTSELNELRDCVIWKHWCKEAKEGRRWEIIDRQNAEVEVIDILFFILSLAQLSGYIINDAKSCTFHNKITEDPEPPGKLLVGFLVAAAAALSPFDEYLHPEDVRIYVHTQLWNWFYYVKILDLTDEQVMNLYNQKWEVNMNRIQRGRLQIGDPLAEAENASIQSTNCGLKELDSH